MKRYVLLVSCPDSPGLISASTKVLSDHGFNIIDQHELVEKQSNMFFMRTIFEGTKLNGVVSSLKNIFKNFDSFLVKEKIDPKLAVLASREYHCLGDLLLKNLHKDLGGNIVTVLSNHEDLQSLVDRFDLPFEHVPVTNGRIEHEQVILDRLKKYKFDYIVTAKYMRIFSPSFVKKFSHKIINIHHSFLPAFIGYNPYEQAFDRGVKLMGATSHFITEDLDQGPIIAQEVMSIDQSWSPEIMAQKGRQAEITALAKALDKVLDYRVIVYKNKTIIF